MLDEILDSAPLPGPTTMAPCSLARLDYDERLEAAVNEQINTEYSLSYVYHALAAFMDRDNVGLPGFAAYFNASSADERHHAGRLMAQQNRRGGRVKLKARLTASSRPSQTMGMCASAHACVHACMHHTHIHKSHSSSLPTAHVRIHTHTHTHTRKPLDTASPLFLLLSQTLLAPESEYASETRGEALWSLELGLALEKLNFAKLR
jgi:hypothetical protein